jgi:chromosome segregation ATPase
MNNQDRIDALNKALNAVNSAITAVQNALQTATDLSDIQRLNSKLADLRAGRQSIQFQMANLQGAAGEIGQISPDTVAQINTLSAQLDQAILNGVTVTATLDFANTVLEKASAMRNAVS